MEEKLSIKQFGQLIKSKHPDYANYPDELIGTKMLEKYPEYNNQVDTFVPNPTGIPLGSETPNLPQPGGRFSSIANIGSKILETGKDIITDPRAWAAMASKRIPLVSLAVGGAEAGTQIGQHIAGDPQAPKSPGEALTRIGTASGLTALGGGLIKGVGAGVKYLKGRKLAEKLAQNTPTFQTGAATKEVVSEAVEGRTKSATSQFNKAREIAKDNIVEVKPRGAVITEGGKVYQTGKPPQQVEGPIFRVGAKKAAQEDVAFLEKTIDAAKLQFSPTYKALKQLASTPSRSPLSLEGALAERSAFSQMTRGEIPEIISQAQRIAKNTDAKYKEDILRSIGKWKDGEKAAEAVKEGWKITAEKHNLLRGEGNLRSVLKSKEPGKLPSQLFARDDASYATLENLSKVSPDVVKKLGKTYLTDALKKNNPKAAWDRLGPKTKKLVFGDKVAELDKAFAHKNPARQRTERFLVRAAASGAAGGALGYAGYRTISNILEAIK